MRTHEAEGGVYTVTFQKPGLRISYSIRVPVIDCRLHQMQGHWWLLVSGNGSEGFAENLGHWEGHGGPGERDNGWKWITCVLPLILAKTESR